MNALQLPLLFQAVFCEPVALEVGHYHSIASFLLPRMTGQASAADLAALGDVSAAMADKPHKFGHQRSGLASPRYRNDGSLDTRYYNTLEGRPEVAVIPWRGVMAKGAGFLQEACMGMVSHDRLSHAIHQALADKEITSIVYDISSPGGSVVGTPELAALVKRSSVYAGSQAAEIYITPSAKIGSIGTILGILDDSVRMQMEGLKLELFTAGKFKGAGSSGRALSEADRAYFQSIVDDANDGFVAAVKQARPGVAKEVLTDAKVYTGTQAAKHGLVDGVVSGWEEFVGLV